MFQNRSSSTESVHANTEAGVNGHCLNSSGKSMEWVSRKRKILKSERNFDYFCKFGVGLRIFSPVREKSRGTFDVELFCTMRRGIGIRISLSKRVKGRKRVGLRVICPSKREKKRASQKRSKESHPLSGKENYDRVDFADRIQKNSMLLFHATNKKSACTKHVSSWSQQENSSC